MVLSAVSTPSAVEVQPMSLSIDPGMPITLKPLSLAKWCAPVSEPLPPMTMSPSAPSFFISCAAFVRPATSRNRALRAEPMMVPPCPPAASTSMSTDTAPSLKTFVSSRNWPSMRPS